MHTEGKNSEKTLALAGLPDTAGCAFFIWDIGGLNVAIPKKRGTGYLKQPYGHHAIPDLDAIAFDESVDMCGLDGYLNLEYGYIHPDSRRSIVDRVMPRLAAHYGFSKWREDYQGFWDVVERFRHNSGVSSATET